MTAITQTAVARPEFPALLRESAKTALIALLLTVALLGLRTVDAIGGLSIDFRFGQVAWVVGAAFAARFLIGVARAGYGSITLMIALIAGITVLLAGGGIWADWYEGIGGPRLPSDIVFVALMSAVLAVAAVSLGHLRPGARGFDRERRDNALDRFAAHVQRSTIVLGPLALIFAVALPFLPFSDRYVVDVATLILMYVMLGWGLNIIVGLAGLLDLGYVAFYAVGAYSYALLAQYFGWSFWLCLPVAGMLAAFAGLMLGFPVLRLRGDYFAIVTLGFGEIIRIVLLNWTDFTGGPNGISGIPRPSFFGLPFDRRPAEGETAFHQFFGIDYDPIHRVIFLYFLILALALLVNYVSLRLRKLPIGRAWEALREDEIAFHALGIDRTKVKLAAFMISATFGGFAGSFFATRQGFISPESFVFIESAIILAIVVLGGMGSQVGIVVAAIILIGLPEVFRELEQYRMLAFGAGMVLIMVIRPRGLLSHREPSVRLGKGHWAGGGAETMAKGG